MSSNAHAFEIDPNSATWRAIEEWMKARLEMRREQLEQCGFPQDETENCRGAIEEINEFRRQLLKAAPEAPVVDFDSA